MFGGRHVCETAPERQRHRQQGRQGWARQESRPCKKSTTFKLFELKKGMYPKPPNEKAIILIAIQARV